MQDIPPLNFNNPGRDKTFFASVKKDERDYPIEFSLKTILNITNFTL